jgi:hypothetical protein
LNGQYDLDGSTLAMVVQSILLSKMLTALFMQQPPNFKPVQTSTDSGSFADSWTKTKECTSSGKSKLHFGHYKAACMHNGLQDFECQLMNFPLQTGYSPRRWQQRIQIMLLKKPNCFHVSTSHFIIQS